MKCAAKQSRWLDKLSTDTHDPCNIPSWWVWKLTMALGGPSWALFNTITAALMAVYGHSLPVRPRTILTSLLCRAQDSKVSFSGHRLTDRRIRSSVMTMSGCSLFQNRILKHHSETLLQLYQPLWDFWNCTINENYQMPQAIAVIVNKPIKWQYLFL